MTFQQAFLEINGYDPTPEQVKHAIAVARIVKEADLDPILLVYLADAQAQAARDLPSRLAARGHAAGLHWRKR